MTITLYETNDGRTYLRVGDAVHDVTVPIYDDGETFDSPVLGIQEYGTGDWTTETFPLTNFDTENAEQLNTTTI